MPPFDAPRPIPEAAALAVSAGLVYVCAGRRGIRREREGGAFCYFTASGRRIDDAASLERIRRLAIPPAYDDVWICADPRGHLQATGRDARGRKQYRYHPQWRMIRDSAKFERMLAFGAALPRLRRRLRRDLAESGMTRARVLALIVSLLDSTRIRIGNDAYRRSNGSFGLTTLRNRHVRFVRDGRLRFCFRGKGGIEHEITVDDRRLVRIVRRCHQLPGQRLFQFVDDAGHRHPVDSDQVNDYLRDALGADFTAKDFRTWGATLRAVALLARMPPPSTECAARVTLNGVVKQVAAELRNTPAVCRNSYINPLVFAAWRAGILGGLAAYTASGRGRRAERITLELLRHPRVSSSGGDAGAGDAASSLVRGRRAARLELIRP